VVPGPRPPGSRFDSRTTEERGISIFMRSLPPSHPPSLFPGCQLVAACDLAIASSHAQFATSGVKLGLFCATPSVPLSRNLSRKRAFEMLVTGKYIQAEKALDWGLVNSVCPHEELEATVLRLVTEIAQNPPVAISMGKRLFYSQLEKSSIAGACAWMGGRGRIRGSGWRWSSSGVIPWCSVVSLTLSTPVSHIITRLCPRLFRRYGRLCDEVRREIIHKCRSSVDPCFCM